MKFDNEDYEYEYEMRRQRRVDEEDKPKVLIGSGLKDCDKVQRFLHTDPHKHVPFFDDSHKVSRKELVWCVFIAVAAYSWITVIWK